MHTLKTTGAIGLLCAVMASACADSPSLNPTSPSAVSGSSSNVQASTAQSGAMAVAVDLTPVAGDNSGLGNGHGNGGGNGNGNGPGNPNANGGGGNGGNPGSNGGGNPNGGGHGNGPPAAPGQPSPKKVELEGLISAIVGNTLTVNGQNVVVPEEVVVHHGNKVVPIADLNIGDRVHIRAILVDDVLTALDVKIQNPDEDAEDSLGDSQLSGVVSALSPNPTTVLACTTTGITFLLGTQVIKTDASTVWDPLTGCTALVNGANVSVDGNLQLDSSILALKITVLP